MEIQEERIKNLYSRKQMMNTIETSIRNQKNML